MRIKKLIVLIFVLLIAKTIFSQSANSSYEIGTWKDFKSAAVTYTFDDNTPNQLAVVVPMFDEYNYKLTLFTVINWGPNWSGLKKAAANGHEVASHTMSHSSLSGLSNTQQNTELKGSQDVINNNVPGMQCKTIAYPNCVVGTDSIVSKYYFAARGCQGFIEGKTPGNFKNISSLICGSQGSVKTASDFNAKAQSAYSSKGWLVYLIHAVDNDNGYSPIASSIIKSSLEYLKTNSEKYWVATFANVAGYIKERNAASVSEISSDEDSIVVNVADNLDDSIYNYPITIRRPAPQDWSSVEVKQNGKTVESKIVEINSANYIMFDAVPDGGNVSIIKTGVTAVEDKDENSLSTKYSLNQNYPNPFNPSTQISFEMPKDGYVSLKVFDTLGREVASLVNGFKQAGKHNVDFGTKNKNLTSGIYFYQLRIGDSSPRSGQVFLQTKKMIYQK